MRKRRPQTPRQQVFGNIVVWDCHLQDLRLLLKPSEAMEFSTHEDTPEDEGLIGYITKKWTSLDDYIYSLQSKRHKPKKSRMAQSLEKT